MIDVGILSPSELKDIVLSKFIALVLQVLPLLAFTRINFFQARYSVVESFSRPRLMIDIYSCLLFSV